MSTEERLNLAAELIRKKEYASARAILVTLDHPKARTWLSRIDQLQPPMPFPTPITPTVAVQAKKRGGCLTSIVTAIAGLGLIWFIALSCLVALVCVGSVAAVVLVSGSLDQTSEAVQANNGFGIQGKPIPVGTWAQFEGSQVRISRPILDITESLLRAESEFINVGDRRYTFLPIELMCQQQECDDGDIQVSYIDSAGDEWNEGASYSVSLLNVGPTERLERVYRNGTSAGWVEISFPPTVTALRSIKITWQNTQTLYFAVPPITVSQE